MNDLRERLGRFDALASGLAVDPALALDEVRADIVDAGSRYVLIERDPISGLAWLKAHATPAEAADEADASESNPERLIDLDTGTEHWAHTLTLFPDAERSCENCGVEIDRAEGMDQELAHDLGVWFEVWCEPDGTYGCGVADDGRATLPYVRPHRPRPAR